MKLNLEQLESRLQALIEIRLVSVLPGFHMEIMVIHKLAEAMKENLITAEDNARLAPNIYTLIVHPETAKTWQDPNLLDAMINSIKIVGEESGLSFNAPPTISITQNPEQGVGEVRVVASHKVEPVADTIGMTPSKMKDVDGMKDSFPRNAFLILEGEQVFPIMQSVFNIGRRLDNQLVIDDPRISRNHAQLRAIKGRFVIFDLNSTGGTFVNGQRTSQSVLYPGDVISLAGVPLVFGQDNPPPRPDQVNTSPIEPVESEHPTAILDRKTSKPPEDE